MKKEKAKVENRNIIEKENTNNTDEILAHKMEKKKVPKQVSQEILKKIFKNLILAIVVMVYFISCNILYTQLPLEQMETITKVISGVFLLASIIILEFAYKRDSGTLTMTAIELLVLSIHALFIYHIITIYQFDFRTYLLTSSFLFAIYYVLKSTIIYTRARIKYLKSLSDISEIVKDEPVIKEAKKRKEESMTEIEEQKYVEKEEKKQKTKAKKETKKNKLKEEKEIAKNEEKEIKEETTIDINKEEKNENQKVSKTKKGIKQNKRQKEEEPKREQQNKRKEDKKSKKEEVIEEVTKQPKPKSKRGRTRKEVKAEK